VVHGLNDQREARQPVIIAAAGDQPDAEALVAFDAFVETWGVKTTRRSAPAGFA
jgi:hypothetical protein